MIKLHWIKKNKSSKRGKNNPELNHWDIYLQSISHDWNIIHNAKCTTYSYNPPKLYTQSRRGADTLTSAERMKLRPIFNRSSRNAATQPLESIFPLRRHYNNHNRMWTVDKFKLHGKQTISITNLSLLSFQKESFQLDFQPIGELINPKSTNCEDYQKFQYITKTFRIIKKRHIHQLHCK